MAIHGRTTEKALEEKTKKKRKLALYKGSRKVYRGNGTRATWGVPLQELIRLEIVDARQREIMVTALSSQDEQRQYQERVKQILAEEGKKKKTTYRIADTDNPEHTVYLTSIPVVFAYRDINRSKNDYYSADFGKGDALQGTKHRCNRLTIYQETKLITDKMGHRRPEEVPCDRECPMAGKKGVCPLGCKVNVDLSFFLYPLMVFGKFELALLCSNSENDVDSLAEQLYNVKCSLGSATEAPGMYETNHSILYNLTKRKTKIGRPLFDKDDTRNGRYDKSEAYVLDLQIEPSWYKKYCDRKSQQFKLEAGVDLPQTRLLEAYDDFTIDADYRTVGDSYPLPGDSINDTPRLIAPSPWKFGNDELENIKALVQKNQWSDGDLIALLTRYGFTGDYSHFYSKLTEEGYRQLCAALESVEAKAMFKH